ncbi:NAD(P)-binding Rossmann-fold superfamily protein [Euphorbia peplus]|nr:NAD(P)-binding Rossmann-fold superfamily protein [Euphorbia peplus]
MSSKEKKVCVTGAGGFLASWLVKLLLSEGYLVNGTVRDTYDDKNVHLKKLEKSAENLKLFKADLLDYEGICSAIEGCTGVFHVASPLPSKGQLVSKEELTKPAVDGTMNVLKACSKANVEKVVVVSSSGAVVLNPNWPKDQVMDEESWSSLEFCEEIKQWYFLSKTRAETEAWEYAKRNKLNLVTVCPALIIGPLLQSTINATSLFLLSFITEGAEPVNNDTTPYVDVRDTAEALLLVYEKPESEGRYICSSYDVTSQHLVDQLKLIYPHHNYPMSFGEATRTWKLSSRKLQDLGWKFRPLKDTIVDSVKSYQDIGALPTKVGTDTKE